jgi:hypothetical protein
MHRDASAVVGGVPADAFARCISEPGRQYAFYIHHSVLRTPKYVVCPGAYQHGIVFDLPAGQYAAQWLNPEFGTVISTEQFKHYGGKITLVTPVYPVDVALKLIGRPMSKR